VEVRFYLGDIDFRRDIAEVTIYYDEWQTPPVDGDLLTKVVEGGAESNHSLNLGDNPRLSSVS
jgi:hypothetical protein